MGTVDVENLDPELHEQLCARAAQEGTTVSEYVLGLILRDLRTVSRRQGLGG